MITRIAKGTAVLATILMLTLAGCGSGGDNSGASDARTTAAEISVPAESQVIEQAVTEQIAEEADAKGSVREILGDWVDVATADRFANITENGGAYQYEDNEGKYPAEFVDGVLKVKLNETDTADVYIDMGSGNLKLIFQDNISEFKRK